MGLLYQPRIQALDVNGNPISGAKLYLYDSVATTTPKASYTNNALTIAHATPIVADSSGVFPQIYATSGTAYYAVLKTSAGVLVDDFDFVTSLGADDASTLERDFGAGGRFQVRGSAGTVYIEVGDPLGDDIGGTGRVGGWDGTQGVLLTVDMATVAFTGNVTVAGTAAITGAATVGGSITGATNLILTAPTSAGSVYAKLASGTATAAASVEITLDADFDAYLIEIYDLAQSAASILTAVLSFDGSTYKTAAGDYIGATKCIAGTTVSDLGSNTYMGLSPATSLASGYGAATLRLRSKAGIESFLKGQVERWDTIGNAVQAWPFALTNAKAYGKAQKIKIAPASGTITCVWALFGIPSL